MTSLGSWNSCQSLLRLVGIVVSVNQFQLGTVSSTTIRAYFSVILVVFLFTSALTFLRTLPGKDVSGMNMAVLGYFSTLLGIVLGLSAATVYPADYQLTGFWLTGIVLSTLFYWTLQRCQKTIKWDTKDYVYDD